MRSKGFGYEIAVGADYCPYTDRGRVSRTTDTDLTPSVLRPPVELFGGAGEH